MRARFGVLRRRAVSFIAAPVAASWALLASGCAGEVLIVGEERPGLPAGEEDPEGPGASTDVVPPPDVALLEDCPPTPAQRRELLGCWPTRHLGTWRGFFIGIPRYEAVGGPAEFPSGDVLLALGLDGGGRLTFGLERATASAALQSVSPCDAPSAPASCEQPGRLIPGFAYRLEEMALFDPMLDTEPRIAGEAPLERPESMKFIVRVGEPWNAWCSDEALAPADDAGDARCLAGDCEKGEWPAPPAPAEPPGAAELGCRCDDQGCRPEAPSLLLELGMSDDEQSLRGSYLPADVSLGRARLELRREPPP